MATADRGSMLICGLQLAAGILERPQAQFLGTLVAEADGLQVTQAVQAAGAQSQAHMLHHLNTLQAA